jgi:hypothetical protein
MSRYIIRQDGFFYDLIEGFDESVELAEQFLGGVEEGEETTFSIQDEAMLTLAVITNRRIFATITFKDLKGSTLTGSSTANPPVKHDVTKLVLNLPLIKLKALADGDTVKSSLIDPENRSWAGSEAVGVIESIYKFFGVCSLSEITQSALFYSWQAETPPQLHERTELATA